MESEPKTRERSADPGTTPNSASALCKQSNCSGKRPSIWQPIALPRPVQTTQFTKFMTLAPGLRRCGPEGECPMLRKANDWTVLTVFTLLFDASVFLLKHLRGA